MSFLDSTNDSLTNFLHPGASSRALRGHSKVARYDLICFSHLRWDFVYQRPQHLLSRCGRDRRVFFFEEPIFGEGPARLEITPREGNIVVVVPCLPQGLREEGANFVQQALFSQLLEQQDIRNFVLWYYTPMALAFTGHTKPLGIIYDCMDELSAFKGAPPALTRYEAELFRRADLVFTGGQSLYESKAKQHSHVHAFPSSVDVPHFTQARTPGEEPSDQSSIAGPRMGFFGVLDERLDTQLLDAVAMARPDWQFILLGPIVKIDPADLPHRPNIHYLGSKSYADLPAYIAHWDVALLPFARNESTRFISPTKTPEYLAAGKPVVSTSICDVIRPYGEWGLVKIADTPDDFIAAIEAAMQQDQAVHSRNADSFLAPMSWDRTWDRMSALIATTIESKAMNTQAQALYMDIESNGDRELESTSFSCSTSSVIGAE